MKMQKTKFGLLSNGIWFVGGFCLFLFFFLLSIPSVHANLPRVEPDFPQNPLQFEQITVNDGLSNDTVQAILQTRDGLMWFGTKNGLNQYNGYDFEVFMTDENTSSSLQDDHINALLEDDRAGCGLEQITDWIFISRR